MRQNQRYGLGLLASNKPRQNLRLYSLKRLRVRALALGGKAFQMFLASLRTEGASQHTPGIRHAAMSHLNRIRGDRTKLLQDGLRLFGRNRWKGRDRVAHHLYFVFAEVFQ